jgi:LuxR family maltose regulon positive regulatory protein
MSSLRSAGHVVDAIGCIRPMAEIRMAQGRLREAMRLYEHGLQLATADDEHVRRGAGDMYVGMAEVSIDLGDLATARSHLAASRDLGERLGLPLNPYRSRQAMARLAQAEGDLAAALELLDEAERRYVGEFYPDVRPAAAMRARIWILQSRFKEASAWAADRGLATDGDLTYLREYQHITFARLLLGRSADERDHPSRDAVEFLDRLEKSAEMGGRGRSVIEISLLLAIAHARSGDTAAAMVSLERALTLAEPEGSVGLFDDERGSVGGLLGAAARAGIAPGFLGRVLRDGPAERSVRARSGLVEPLTEREIEVLRLLSTDLDGPGIARELVVALSTVRSHTKSIYAKLGVSTRRAAVRRSDDLGLLLAVRRS